MSNDLVTTRDGRITFDLEHLTGRWWDGGERFVIRRVEFKGMSRIPLSARGVHRRDIVDTFRDYIGIHRVFEYDNNGGYVNICLDNVFPDAYLAGIMIEAEVTGD